MLSRLQLSSGPNELSAETTEGGSKGALGMRLWKAVTVSGDDMWLGLGLCIGALSFFCGVMWSWTGCYICCWLGNCVCGCIGCCICCGTGFCICCGTGLLHVLLHMRLYLLLHGLKCLLCQPCCCTDIGCCEWYSKPVVGMA